MVARECESDEDWETVCMICKWGVVRDADRRYYAVKTKLKNAGWREVRIWVSNWQKVKSPKKTMDAKSEVVCVMINAKSRVMHRKQNKKNQLWDAYHPLIAADVPNSWHSSWKIWWQGGICENTPDDEQSESGKWSMWNRKSLRMTTDVKSDIVDPMFVHDRHEVRSHGEKMDGKGGRM